MAVVMATISSPAACGVGSVAFPVVVKAAKTKEVEYLRKNFMMNVVVPVCCSIILLVFRLLAFLTVDLFLGDVRHDIAWPPNHGLGLSH